MMKIFELFNNLTPKLYHGTSVMNAASILHENRIKSQLWHNKPANGKNTVSLTRSFSFAHKFSVEQVVFELDANKLRHNYKLIPVDYYRGALNQSGYGAFRSETEEACIGDITHLDRYLLAIHITSKEYHWCEEHDENLVEGHKDFEDLLNHPLLRIMKSGSLSKDEKIQSHETNPTVRFR